MNRLLAVPVTIVNNGEVQEVREYIDLYVILPIVGYVLMFALLIWLIRINRSGRE